MAVALPMPRAWPLAWPPTQSPARFDRDDDGDGTIQFGPCRPRHTSPRVPAGGARLVGGGGGGADARHVVTCPWKAAPGAARVAPAAVGLPQKGERLAAAVGASARGRFVWATRAQG